MLLISKRYVEGKEILNDLYFPERGLGKEALDDWLISMLVHFHKAIEIILLFAIIIGKTHAQK